LNEIKERYGADGEEAVEHPSADDETKPDQHVHENGYNPAPLFEEDGNHEQKVVEAAIVVPEVVQADEHSNGHGAPELTPAQLERLHKEIDSIAFYIDNDYYDLADRALNELARELGEQPEITRLRMRMGKEAPDAAEIVKDVDEDARLAQAEQDASPVEVEASTLGINEIRTEFGLGGDDNSCGDYDTHYQMGVAYQEMGLMENAIREYQDAVNIARPDDGTRRFFLCANLLGHCFRESGKPHHAVTWLERALEVPNLKDDEQHGIWYELGLAHEANGEEEKAANFFERIYAENVDFRDVATRVSEGVGSH
jgi:tetratricopeptide (TPR) repeat protein